MQLTGPVRPRGGGTKLDWGGSGEPAEDLSTAGLDRILAHRTGDFTATLQAGVRLADAQRTFAEAHQMLALDPPGEGATIGGIIATADSGPLRHRYGTVRDLILGIEVQLSDGSRARAGGQVIKNVAGYDLMKLFAGSFGTLGLIREVTLRLHPLPGQFATVTGRSDNPATLARVARDLAGAPLEAECLDVSWERHGAGRVLVRFAGRACARQAQAVAARMALDDVRIHEDDERLWQQQRALQRSGDTTVLRVSALPGDVERVLGVARYLGGNAVMRAGVGVAWLAVEDPASARTALAPRPCVRLDGPGEPWPEVDPGALAVMRRVKARFDPERWFRPGAFVGGI